MSPEELERVRARDAALVPGMPMTQGAMLNVAFAAADRRLLLAEVDRLEAALRREHDAAVEVIREEHAEVVALQDRHERIRSAIENLPSVHEVPAWGTDNLTIYDYLERQAVLDLFDDSDGVYIGPIQHSNGQCWTPEDHTCHCWCAVCERHNAAAAKAKEDEVLQAAADAALDDFARGERGG